MSTLNEILNEAVPRWADLTGTKLGTSSYTMSFGNSEFQDHDLKKYIDQLNDARTLDVSGTTAILLLRGLFEAYVKEKSFKLHTLLYAPATIEKTLAPLRTFHDLITQAPCEEAITTFREALRAAAVHYGYDLHKLKACLDDRTLGDLRLAAAQSMEDLAIHQFTQGVRDPKPLQYNRQIFEFSSINSFVHALRRQLVSGITLALIRASADELDTCKAYFVLGMRNGETITILTDFQEGSHPEYHNMTRRPDRRLAERAKRHWFPYRLLEEDPVKHKQKKHALVPLDAKAQSIEDIPNLEPSEFIWLILLLDLVAAKLDRDDYKTAELSYTGEMVVAPHALVDAQNAMVLAGQYQPLVLPKLTVATTTAELAGNKTPIGHNAWLEDRYRDRVPEILLDVVGTRRALEVGKTAEKLLPGDIKHENLPKLRRQPGALRWGDDRRLAPIDPKALDPSYFGTSASVARTRAWYARANLIKGVQRLATADYAAKAETIVSWYRKRIERNMAFLWRAVAHGELVAPITSWKGDDVEDEEGGFPDRDMLRWTEGNILQQKAARNWSDAFRGKNHEVRFGEWSYSQRCLQCALDPPTRATVFTAIQPDNPRALALLMGIPERKLPWPLQHWTTHEPYPGNSLLDRIDPQDAQLDNPWRHLELGITIALSKRAYNRLRKEHGLEPKREWPEEE